MRLKQMQQYSASTFRLKGLDQLGPIHAAPARDLPLPRQQLKLLDRAMLDRPPPASARRSRRGGSLAALLGDLAGSMLRRIRIAHSSVGRALFNPAYPMLIVFCPTSHNETYRGAMKSLQSRLQISSMSAAFSIIVLRSGTCKLNASSRRSSMLSCSSASR